MDINGTQDKAPTHHQVSSGLSTGKETFCVEPIVDASCETLVRSGYSFVDKNTLSIATYFAECVTIWMTVYYTAVQLFEPFEPIEERLSVVAHNGFCLPWLQTHLFCALYDACIVVLYCVILSAGTDRSVTMDWVVLCALMLHVWGHATLFWHTREMSLQEANDYRHWSFSIVLVAVNTAYCVPRIMLYPPADVTHRVGGGSATSSLGIMGLAAVAMAERLHCDCMASVGGHVFYDVCIGTVAIMRLIE